MTLIRRSTGSGNLESLCKGPSPLPIKETQIFWIEPLSKRFVDKTFLIDLLTVRLLMWGFAFAFLPFEHS